MNDRQSQHPSFTLTEADAAYFGEIPASWLKVLKLLHHEKMNYVEIAKQVDLPRGTVCTRIFHARQIIRRRRAEDEARNETWQEPVFQ
jgi:DNA-directed RNA polymerase specialized sigma24 family protein